MLPIADANILLRYILNDNMTQFELSKNVIENGCETTVEVLSEVAYVLRDHYDISRDRASQIMLNLLDEVHVERREVARYALRLYGKRGLDFVDCVLAAEHFVNDRDIATFDKKLLRLVA